MSSSADKLRHEYFDQRQLDLLVYGANGFVGHLVCEYINRNYGGIKWAIAGRSDKELHDLINGELRLDSNIPRFAVDAHDKSALKNIFEKAKVVVNVSGPYILAGEDIVEACIDAKTHYVDIAGEPPFMRKMIDRHHTAAERNHLKIVHACGFDCIPADIGTYMIVEELKRSNLNPTEVRLFLEESRGSISTGTMASLIEIFNSSTVWDIIQMASPYYLNPRDEKSGRPAVAHVNARITLKASDNTMIGYDFAVHSWTAPYLMQFIDTRVVNRSNALQNWAYSRNFVFSERMKMRNFFMAMLVTILVTIFNLFMLNPISRRVAKLFLPSRTKGPSQYILENGYFKILLVGKGIDVNSPKQDVKQVKGRITAMNGDPGYKQTAKMVVEAALAIVQDFSKLPQSYGLLTPSVAFGAPLINRLQQKNILFSIEK
eukprot:gene34747-42073_t